MILFHHRAEIGCGKWVRTIDCAFKERRVTDYSIPQALLLLLLLLLLLIIAPAQSGCHEMSRSKSESMSMRKTGGPGGSCNLTISD